MSGDRPRFDDFEAFWPYYVGEHSKPLCRALHYVAAVATLSCVAAAIIRRDPLWLVLAPVVSYGIAWTAHFFIERNKPATFGYLLWSLRAEFKMFALFLCGRMGREVARYCPPPSSASPATSRGAS